MMRFRVYGVELLRLGLGGQWEGLGWFRVFGF